MLFIVTFHLWMYSLFWRLSYSFHWSLVSLFIIYCLRIHSMRWSERSDSTSMQACYGSNEWVCSFVVSNYLSYFHFSFKSILFCSPIRGFIIVYELTFLLSAFLDWWFSTTEADMDALRREYLEARIETRRQRIRKRLAEKSELAHAS
jgi:hypothetical protein